MQALVAHANSLRRQRVEPTRVRRGTGRWAVGGVTLLGMSCALGPQSPPPWPNAKASTENIHEIYGYTLRRIEPEVGSERST